MLTPPVMPKSRLALSQVALPALPVRWDEAPLCVHSAASGGLEKCRNSQKKSMNYIFLWQVDRQGYEPVSRVRKSVSLPSPTPSICLCTSSPFLPVLMRPRRMGSGRSLACFELVVSGSDGRGCSPTPDYLPEPLQGNRVLVEPQTEKSNTETLRFLVDQEAAGVGAMQEKVCLF